MRTEADSEVSRLIGVALLFGAILFAGLLIYIEEQKGVECFDSLKSVFGRICVVPRDSYEELLDK